MQKEQLVLLFLHDDLGGNIFLKTYTLITTHLLQQVCGTGFLSVIHCSGGGGCSVGCPVWQVAVW
jgi:hypothetical protein